jgi:hypothetical protein
VDLTGDTIIIYPGKGRLILLSFLALALVGCGVWLVALFVTGEHGSLPMLLVGCISALFFGYGAFFLLRRTFAPEPSLVVGPDGLLDNASVTCAGFISWEEVEVIFPYRFQRQWFLGMIPRDLEAILARQPLFKRKAMTWNIALGAAPINVPQNILPMPVTTLARVIAERYPVHVDLP